MHLRLTSHRPQDTQAIAADLVRHHPGLRVIALRGELGAGKTCFVQGLADGLGIGAPVTSPTYTLIHEYPGPRRLIHADLYRIGGEEEAEELALHEYAEAGALVAIEWPERATALLPPDVLWVELREGDGPEDREIEVTGGPSA